MFARIQRIASTRRAVSVVLLMLSAAAAGLLHAQVPTGSISGLVTDPKDAVVAGAQVVATSIMQGFVRNTLSNGSGLYVLPDLPAGEYTLRIS